MKKKIEQSDNEPNITDNNLSNAMNEANNDFDKLCDIYRNYVGKSETSEERFIRIQMFRCRGNY